MRYLGVFGWLGIALAATSSTLFLLGYHGPAAFIAFGAGICIGRMVEKRDGDRQ